MNDFDDFVDVNAGAGGVGFKIESVWAFLAVHNDGDEGVAAVMGPQGWIPMLAADQTRLEQLIPKARALAKSSGKRMRLVRFESRSEIEVFHPDGRRERSG